ncbi:MAG: calcium-translocating P-type ATPase, PMCA-type [Candidatus Azobacteroides sp.]|nr:calcium-translocating P-type ATPase, PMCA-type [Candidatus Azobacteroides sp.]
MEQKKHFTGLTETQVSESREKYGNNILTPPEKEPVWKLFLEKFKDPIVRILLIAAFLSLIISFVHWEFTETIGIFCAIFLATGVSFWFELDANKKFDVLNQVNDDTLVKVIREDHIQEVPKKDIVVGDVVIIETGDEVPADGELLEAVALQIDESTLTGELSISKTTDPESFKADVTYPSNWVMRGTKVLDGHGIMEVARVGDATEYGKVARKATETSGEETPLNQQLDKLARFIGVVGFVLAILTFSTLFLKDILFGGMRYTMPQLLTIGIVLISLVVALAKIWVPIAYDALELMGKKKEIPGYIQKGTWLRWILFGLLTFLVLSGVLLLFNINLLSSQSWVDLDVAGQILQYFMVAVTLIVVAVPEGLPMSVTLSLALSMRRMLQNNNLVRKMHACETMGAATVICTDKTGTLTQNQMQVFEIRFFALPEQQLKENELSNIIKENIAVNSTAYLDFSDPEKIHTLGNPTEAALLLWLNKQGVNYLDIRESAEIIDQLTFSTERKFMATLAFSPTLNKKILFIKGAPEIVLSKSEKVLSSSGVVPKQEKAKEIEELLLSYQNQAMRTLGFAYEIVEDNKPRFENGEMTNANLTYIGIAAISDPVREDVPAAVEKCLQAGIDVKIVTGDTPGTAREIARQIGIWKENEADEHLINGVDFEALSDAEALSRVKDMKVMCRARPTDKQRLVQLLQKRGEIVAVTGDGTNDAPALNYAHVGLSMGSGTSVAKEASDITLLDDSFNSIVTAVMWGRSLYQNIQRFLLFQLTINVTALILVFIGSIFGEELPLTVTQMLWVNLIMDTFAAGALASLPPNEKVMKDKPRKNDAFIITRDMAVRIFSAGLVFVVVLLGLLFMFTHEGIISEYDLSRFFTIFVMLQFWNMFNAKAFLTGRSAFSNLRKSQGFILVAFIILIGQILIVEFGGEAFRTVPISFKDWFIIIAATSPVLWTGEIIRFFATRKQRD